MPSSAQPDRALLHARTANTMSLKLQPTPLSHLYPLVSSLDTTPATPPGISPEGHGTHPSRRSIIKRNLHTYARKQNLRSDILGKSTRAKVVDLPTDTKKWRNLGNDRFRRVAATTSIQPYQGIARYVNTVMPKKKSQQQEVPKNEYNSKKEGRKSNHGEDG